MLWPKDLAGAGSIANIMICNNTFTNMMESSAGNISSPIAINLMGGGDNITIQGNLFAGIRSTNTTIGCGIMATSSSRPLRNLNLSGNIFQDIRGTAIYLASSFSTNVLIANNVFDGCGLYFWGGAEVVYLYGLEGGSVANNLFKNPFHERVQAIGIANAKNVPLTGNVIGGGQQRWLCAISIRPGCTNVAYSDNVFSGVITNVSDLSYTNCSVPCRIYGKGPPTNSHPTGTIYIRTDGDSGTTLYVREGTKWTAK
jgi:hypothetical protein